MSDKQIYASVEIADHEVRLVVGEFYETRFNILRVEKVRFNGVEDSIIVNESNVVTALILSLIHILKPSVIYLSVWCIAICYLFFYLSCVHS